MTPLNNRKHAEKLLAERLAQINRGEFIEPSKVTFREFKDIWLEKYARGQVRASSLARYLSLFLTAITTGLRIGELLAMKWQNLDWKRGQYFVCESLTRLGQLDQLLPKGGWVRRA